MSSWKGAQTIKRQSINVRTLAEFALESGDLRSQMMLADRMQDGMQGHRMLQGGYPEGYKSEVSVALDALVEGIPLRVQGRIDGLLMGDIPLIDEIKTTSGDPSRIREDDHPVHWAQAEIYAHMVCVQHGAARAKVQLSYFNLGGALRQFAREYSAAELAQKFEEYAAPYALWMRSVGDWQRLSLPTLADLRFPFGEYRDGQTDMIEQIHESICDGKSLLCQAPTGIGKTAGALFPAIRALGEGAIERIFYLTARTTTRAVAEATIERMREHGLKIRSLTLTAKDKICLYPGERCTPELCQRARNYSDKRRPAMHEALAVERLQRPVIEAIAQKHDICPFELSLDLSEISDVVICDYNHAFDPRVKLKRFFLDKGDYALLVDEAHNLIDRSREMLSATIAQRDFEALRREATRLGGADHPLVAPASALIETLKALPEQYDEPAMEQNPPEPIKEAAIQFVEAAQRQLSEPIEHALDCYFMALDYLRTLDQYDESYRTLIDPNEKNARVKLWCYDASEYLEQCFRKVRSGVLFSATLSPMHYYFQALGLSERRGDAMLDLPSPFPDENLLVVQRNLSTRFSQRQQTAPQIAQAILQMCRAKNGNYLACFPSHAYLNMLLPYLSDGSVRVMAQRGAMSEPERAQFLAQFRSNPAKPLLALIAMGGVFSEGVDLPGELLSGAAIVGVGMPGIGFEREMLKQLKDEYENEGYLYAYAYPGIERVLQAAGRVIRTETDMGVVLLLDDRYQIPEIRELLPAHWQVRHAADAQESAALLSRFWTGNI